MDACNADPKSGGRERRRVEHPKRAISSLPQCWPLSVAARTSTRTQHTILAKLKTCCNTCARGGERGRGRREGGREGEGEGETSFWPSSIKTRMRSGELSKPCQIVSNIKVCWSSNRALRKDCLGTSVQMRWPNSMGRLSDIFIYKRCRLSSKQ